MSNENIGKKYWKPIKGNKDGKIDIYGICETFHLSPARSHAVKKILMAGERGVKSIKQDLQEAIVALEREIEIVGVLGDWK